MKAPVAGRIPPHDLDAEAAVLSAVMLEKTALDLVLEFLRPEQFYSEANRHVFAAAVELHRKGVAVDVVSVSGELRDRERLTQVGGTTYLAQLVDCVPFVAHVDQYARRVQAKWRVRQLIATCHKLAAEGYGDIGDDAEFINQAEAEIYQAVHVDEVSDEKTLGECAEIAYKRMVETHEGGGRIRGVRCHLDPLDNILGGFREGKFTIVAAAPGVGKSMLTQTIAINVAKFSEGTIGVQVFTPEMTDEELGERSIASEAEIDSMAFRCKIGNETWHDIFGAVQELHKYPVWITDDADVTTTKMRARIRRRQQEFNRYDEAGKPVRRVGVVILDYLQLLNTQTKKGQSREEAISLAARELKTMAMKLRVHVIAVSSLNRSIANRQDKRPILSDLRESGAIEFHADNILFLYRDSYYNENCLHPEEAEVHVAKQRGGPTGTVTLHFNKGQSRFENPRRESSGVNGAAHNPPHWSESAQA